MDVDTGPTVQNLYISKNFTAKRTFTKSIDNNIVCENPNGYGAIRDDGWGNYSEYQIVGYLPTGAPLGHWVSVDVTTAARKCDRWLGFSEE